MIEIGKTYRLAGRNAEVEIVASGVDSGSAVYSDAFRGQFFVGVTRNDGAFGDWVAEYDENGRRLWDSPHDPTDSDRWNLVVPPRLVNLTQVEKLIRNLAGSLDISEDAAETVLEAISMLEPA